MSAFSLRIDFRCVLHPKDSVLSLSTLRASSKKVLRSGPVVDDRMLPREHYARLDHQPETPLVVASARNVLSNVRCLGYDSRMCRRLGVPSGSLAVVDEEPETPGRAYHVICYANGRFVADEFSPEGRVRDPQVGLNECCWLVSGTPVLWDCDERELFDRMITDAADVAHVWKLPRGNNPNATRDSETHWDLMHSVFRDTLQWDRAMAAERIRDAARGLNLDRESGYLHSVWGVRDTGELIIVIAHGRLEDVGQKAREVGATRAICVENGGSVALYYVLNDSQPWLPIIRAPNLRPSGTAFAFFSLRDASFACLPAWQVVP